MLDALVGVVAGLLILAGVMVILGPQTMTMLRRIRGITRSRNPFAALQAPRTREPAASGLNPKTQRVLASATRLATWLRAHGQDEIARELRVAAAKLATDEASGLYAMQNTLRRLRGLRMPRMRRRIVSACGPRMTRTPDSISRPATTPTSASSICNP